MQLIKAQSDEVGTGLPLEWGTKILIVQVQKVVKPVLQTNAYFAMPEVLVTSMLEDPREEVRRKGALLIIATRKNPPKISRKKIAQGVRLNPVPKINWTATDWTEIIQLGAEKVTISCRCFYFYLSSV